MRFLKIAILSFMTAALLPNAGALAQPSPVESAQQRVNSANAQLQSLLSDQAATKKNIANLQKRADALRAEDVRLNRSSGDASEADRVLRVAINRLIDIEQNIPDYQKSLANARAELATAQKEAAKAAKAAKAAAKTATPAKSVEPAKTAAPAKAAESAKTANPKLAKCNQYADEAISKVNKAITTCGVGGTRWSRDRKVHFDGCMGPWGTDANLKSEATIRAALAANCGARKAACTAYKDQQLAQVKKADQMKCNFKDIEFGRDPNQIMDWCYGSFNAQGGYRPVPDQALKNAGLARDKRLALCAPAPARK